MKSLHRDTRLKHAYNPTGELVSIMAHKIRLYKRFKRRYPKDRYDIGGI